MLKLHSIYLRKFLTLFITVFLTLGVILYFWIKSIILDEIKTDLLHNINIFSLQLNNIDRLDDKAKEVKKLTKIRVTVIDKNGVVVAESDYDKKSMSNHKNRAEIITSKYQEYGSSLRYSKTVKKDLLYLARMFKQNDETYYIRMAKDTNNINKTFLAIIVKISILFLIVILITFRITMSINKKIQNETKDILKFLRKLTKQKSSISISSNFSSEFSKITKLLSDVSKALEVKDKQKTKYTSKLKLLNKQKDDIIAAISHEFKNPIAIINGYAQTLTQDKNINPNIQARFLEKIFTNTNKLTQMIDRLRLSIRLSDGKKSLSLIECDLVKITTVIIQDLKLTYPNREIILKSTKINIKADEILIGIAITNLIENALKYSSSDIRVDITEKNITVIDSGIGINEDEISKITGKFYRVSNNGWNNSLGVGLSLVSNIVNLHNFTLDIKSEENIGSAFSIYFSDI